MLFSNFKLQVKKEARLDGDTGYDDLIKQLINEFLLEAAMQQKSPALADVVEIALALGDGEVDLPADFLREETIRLFLASGSSWKLHDKRGVVPPAPRGFYGYPKSYVINGTTLRLEPEEAIGVGDTVQLEYYKRPTIDADEDDIPDRLIPYALRATIQRLHIEHDRIETAAMFGETTTSAASGSAVANAPDPVKE